MGKTDSGKPDPAKAANALRDILVSDESVEGDSVIDRALRAVRSHLGLQVAYVSEFVGNDTVFRSVDAPGLEHLIKPGDSRSLDDVYCRHILDGSLPQLIGDTADYPLAASMPITAAVPIGAHVSVPLRSSDGDIYGMFCCLGPNPDRSLNDRDLAMMQAFADLTMFEIERDLEASRETRGNHERIERVLADEDIAIVYQPIWGIASSKPVGFECLARFAAEPIRTPDLWFAEAAAVGLGVELELLAIRLALDALQVIGDGPYLAFNASPATVLDPRLAELLADVPLDRIVIEITEHDSIEDFPAMLEALTGLRAGGLRLAVDDAGAGYSGLQQILQMKPDLIKLDRFLIQGIGSDASRKALAAALTLFARETGSAIVAEGVETEAELAMLRSLGVSNVQGYLLGRPQTIDEIRALLADGRRAARA